jgi:cbb3-type cytochrome oxidase cytochrome c subunit
VKRRQPRRLLVFCLVVAALSGIALAIALVVGKSPPRRQGVVAGWVESEHLPRAAVAGARVFAAAGCTVCHTYAGSGRTALGAPDLTAIGRRHLGTAFLVRFLDCPTCVDPESPMPRFASLGDRRLRQLAVFLRASKGVR